MSATPAERARRWYTKHRTDPGFYELRRARTQAWRAAHPEQAKVSRLAAVRKWNITHWRTYYTTHKDALLSRGARWRQKVRDDVIAGYGGRCACCGETEHAFLTLDHVNGGGGRERRSIPGGQWVIYTRVRREGYPPGFRILCWNCNAATRFSRRCPHTEGAQRVGND